MTVHRSDLLALLMQAHRGLAALTAFASEMEKAAGANSWVGVEEAIALAQPGDVVLIAGKGHEQGQDVAGVISPFDDREVAREVLA